MLLLDSLYINNSGGLVLLNYLIRHIDASNISCTYLIDDRNPTDYSYLKHGTVVTTSASLKSRKNFYNNVDQGIKTVLCFGNIPPPKKLGDRTVFTYLHQYFYLDTTLSRKSFKAKMVFRLKRIYLKSLFNNTTSFWVQSSHMESGLRHIGYKGEVSILPLFERAELSSTTKRDSKKYVYISNGNPHKNHTTLLKAWKKFNEKNPDTELHLTVGAEYAALTHEIDRLKPFNVTNHGLLKHREINDLLASSTYLIYPSLAESFGLVLVESIAQGCKVIGSNLDYLHAVIEPSATFDPLSNESIYKTLLETAKSNSVQESTVKAVNKVNQMVQLLRNT